MRTKKIIFVILVLFLINLIGCFKVNAIRYIDENEVTHSINSCAYKIPDDVIGSYFNYGYLVINFGTGDILNYRLYDLSNYGSDYEDIYEAIEENPYLSSEHTELVEYIKFRNKEQNFDVADLQKKDEDDPFVKTAKDSKECPTLMVDKEDPYKLLMEDRHAFSTYSFKKYLPKYTIIDDNNTPRPSTPRKASNNDNDCRNSNANSCAQYGIVFKDSIGQDHEVYFEIGWENINENDKKRYLLVGDKDLLDNTKKHISFEKQLENGNNIIVHYNNYEVQIDQTGMKQLFLSNETYLDERSVGACKVNDYGTSFEYSLFLGNIREMPNDGDGQAVPIIPEPENPSKPSNPELEDECDAIFGDPDDPKKESVAYWIQWILNIIKYVAIVILLVLSTVDFFQAMVKNDKSELKKVGIKTLKRFIYTVLIFFLPIIVEMILKLFGVYCPSVLGK